MGRPRTSALNLPEGVERVRARGRTYYYWNPGRGTVKPAGERIRLPDAEARPAAFFREVERYRAVSEARQTLMVSALPGGPVVDYLRDLLASSTKRASARELPHTITLADLTGLLHQQKSRCAVCGLAFSLESIGSHPFMRPFAPSIDRIDNAGGYQPDNIRLVSRLVNYGMGRWGEIPFVIVAMALARRLQGGIEGEQ